MIYLNKLTDLYPESPLRARALKMMADNLINLKNYSLALENLNKISQPPAELKAESSF